MNDYIDIKEVRKQLGMTQLELAYTLGVTPTTVSRWERDDNKPSRLALASIKELMKRRLPDHIT